MNISSKTFQEFVEDQKENFGIVVLGAGAPLDAWVNGIAEELKDAEIITTDNPFEYAYTISDNVLGSDGRTDLVLVFKKTSKPNMGKMALWRLGWNGAIGWTGDFIANHRIDYASAPAVQEVAKPHVQLTGEDGNVFSVIASCSKALKLAGQKDKAAEFEKKAYESESYDAVLSLAMEYCDVA